MTTPDHDDHTESWEHIGRAAEHFARRVARDAGKFAERMQEHAGEFADDVSRDWRRAQRGYRRSCGRVYRAAAAPEVRRVFEDIRTVLADVLEGVDELIARVFVTPDAPSTESEWVRVVTNRDAECVACKRAIVTGDEAFVRRAAGEKQFRCIECGPPPDARG